MSREIVTAVSKVETTFLKVIAWPPAPTEELGCPVDDLGLHLLVLIYHSSGTFSVFLQQHHILIRAYMSCKKPSAAGII